MIHKTNLIPPKYVLLRAPVLPIEYSSLSSKEYMKHKSFEVGVLLSSNLLYNELRKEKGGWKIQESLSKYWARACHKPIPFATFAGVNLINIDETSESKVILCENGMHKVRIRLDYAVVYRMIEKLMTDDNIKRKCLVHPNPTLYKLKEKFRYIETVKNGEIWDFRLAAVKSDNLIENILGYSQEGVTYDQLTSFITNCEKEVTEQEAEAFIDELISEQILTPNIYPSLTGSDQPSCTELILKGCPNATDFKDLENVDEILKRVTTLEEIEEENFAKVINKINDFLEIKEPLKDYFQCDMRLNTQKSIINQNLVDTIIDQCLDLYSLNRRYNTAELGQYYTKFKEKFGNRAVPLMLALDPEYGISYGNRDQDSIKSKIVDDLHYQNNFSTNNTSLNFDYIQKFVLSKYQEFLKENLKQIDISERDIIQLREKMGSDEKKFPNGMYIMGSLFSSNKRLNSNNFQFNLQAIGGVSSATLMTRFAHLDTKLNEYIEEQVELEEANDEVIYAEVVHLPYPKIGNISQRPLIRKFEIEAMGISGSNTVIPLSDIYVTVAKDEVQIFSKSTRKRIVPRLTNAHNFTINPLPIYKFLCDLQIQNMSFPGVWDWGILNDNNALPRVVYKNIIIQRAKWNINREKIKVKSNDSLDIIKEKVFSYFGLNSIPTTFQYRESGLEIVLNLEQTIALEFFLKTITRKENITITEYLNDEPHPFVTDVQGNSYANELVIPFVTPNSDATDKSMNNPFSSLQESIPTIKRTFAPFEEWTYFKIYGSEKKLELFLINLGKSSFMANKPTLFEKFFFIRYYDPEPHIRIRFYNSDIEKRRKLNAIFTEYVAEGIKAGTIEDLTLAKYERELERYEFPLIEISEDIFCSDSWMALRILQSFSLTIQESELFIICLYVVNEALNAFDFNLADKHKFASSVYEMYFDEFKGDSFLKKNLNNKYRGLRQQIMKYMNGSHSNINIFSKEINVRNAILCKAKSDAELYAKKNNINKDFLLKKLLHSYSHMTINRLFPKNQRLHELCVYHCLERHYNSLIARES